jgi:hypothetical protein
MRTWVRRALLLLLALEALWAVPVNLVLNTPLADRLVNRKPERFRIDWRLAVSPWPGLVHLRGVATHGQSRTIQWEARLRSVTATFALEPLRRRVVDLGQVRASGIRYAQRPRLDAGEEPPPEAFEWPPIADRKNPPDAAPGAVGPKQPGRPWTVRAGRILGGVEEIWIGRYRLAGAADVDATLDLTARGPLALPRLDFRLAAGTMQVGTLRMFEGLQLDIQARLDRFVPRGKRAVDVLRALSGRFDLEARDGSLKFLEAYFRKVQGLELNGGGPMRLHMLVEAGRLQPGSRLERSRDRIDTTFLGNRITGLGTVGAEVEPICGIPMSRVALHVPRYEVARAGAAAPFAHGEEFRLEATSANLDLTDPFADVHLDVGLEREEIPDLSVYNVFLPQASRARIVSGLGRMSWRFEGSSAERSLHGVMRFDLLDLALRFEETTLRGDVRIDATLRHGDPRGRAFDISGTSVTLEHRAPRWRGRIRFPSARLEFTEPMRIEARTRLQLQDTRPLVRIFDAFKDLSPRLERFLTIEDLKGGTGFVVRPDAVDLRDLAIEGKGLRARAELTLGDRGKEGILYVRFHGLSFGVALQPGKKRDLKLVRPLAWFERERARRPR